MKLFQRLSRASIAFSLVLSTLVITVLGFASESWAATLPAMSSVLPHPPVVMSVFNRTKATGQNLEGKVQESYGKLTGDRQAQVKGQAKQTASQARNAVEDVKESSPANRLKAGFKSVTGKVQEAVGDIAGDPKMQAEGKAKQVEGQVRNVVEDARSGVQRTFQ